jgi:hypothetical protein
MKYYIKRDNWLLNVLLNRFAASRTSDAKSFYDSKSIRFGVNPTKDSRGNIINYRIEAVYGDSRVSDAYSFYLRDLIISLDQMKFYVLELLDE